MSKQTIQAKIEIVRNETQNRANSKTRIAELFTLLNNEKFDAENSFTKPEITAKIEEVKNLALTGFVGRITPSSPVPDGDFWAIATEGNYPDGIVVDAGKVSILTKVNDVWAKVEVNISAPSAVFDPNTETLPQGGKQIATAFKDVVLFSGNKDLVLNETSPSSTYGWLYPDGSHQGTQTFYYSGFIKIKDISFGYKTTLWNDNPTVITYDENKVLIEGKTSNLLTNNYTGPVDRFLDTDFDLTNAVYVRIGCISGSEISISYGVNLLKDNTTDKLIFGETKALNADAVKPLQDEINVLELIVDTQANTIGDLVRELEDMTIDKQPLYVEMATSFNKGFNQSFNDATKIFNILTRDNDNQFSTTISELSAFPTNNVNHQIVVKTITGRHIPIRCKINTSTGVVTAYDTLPANFAQWSLLWGDSIHLSRWGY